MILSLGKRRAIRSRVPGRMRSELTSLGVLGSVRFTIPVWNSRIIPYSRGSFVDRPVAPVVERILRPGDLTESAKTGSMEAIHKLNALGSSSFISPIPTRRPGCPAMAAVDVLQIARRSDEQRNPVQSLHLRDKLFEKRLLPVVMNVAIDQLRRRASAPVATNAARDRTPSQAS